MIAENLDSDSEAPGGLGGKVRSERTESGLTAIHESRMLTTAVKRGWIPGQRWPVDATPTDFRRVEDERELTLKERAAYAVLLDIGNADPRVRQISVRNALSMEAQNMDQEAATRPQQPLEVNVRGVVVHVAEDETWYGNGAFEASRLREAGANGTENGSAANGNGHMNGD